MEIVLAEAQARIGTYDGTLIPNINASKWGDDGWLNINYEPMVNPDAQVDGETVRLTKGNEQVEIWKLNDDVIETKLILAAKPAQNQFSFRLKGSAGLQFHFQRPLTAEEIANGDSQHPRVTGSYAVYSPFRHNQYKTGKVAHLYRWIAWDSNGQSTFCDMLVDGGYLHVIVPGSFLDASSYPVSLMGYGDTFGYNTAGGNFSTQGTTSSALLSVGSAESHTASTGDTVTQLHWYGNDQGTSGNVNMTLYTGVTGDSGGDGASRAFAATAVACNSITNQWWSSATISLSLSNGVTYWTAYGNADSDWQTAYDFVGYTASSFQADENLPATWSESFALGRVFSMYATYTTGGGGGTAVPVFYHHYRTMKAA